MFDVLSHFWICTRLKTHYFFLFLFGWCSVSASLLLSLPSLPPLQNRRCCRSAAVLPVVAVHVDQARQQQQQRMEGLPGDDNGGGDAPAPTFPLSSFSSFRYMQPWLTQRPLQPRGAKTHHLLGLRNGLEEQREDDDRGAAAAAAAAAGGGGGDPRSVGCHGSSGGRGLGRHHRHRRGSSGVVNATPPSSSHGPAAAAAGEKSRPPSWRSDTSDGSANNGSSSSGGRPSSLRSNKSGWDNRRSSLSGRAQGVGVDGAAAAAAEEHSTQGNGDGGEDGTGRPNDGLPPFRPSLLVPAESEWRDDDSDGSGEDDDDVGDGRRQIEDEDDDDVDLEGGGVDEDDDDDDDEVKQLVYSMLHPDQVQDLQLPHTPPKHRSDSSHSSSGSTGATGAAAVVFPDPAATAAAERGGGGGGAAASSPVSAADSPNSSTRSEHSADFAAATAFVPRVHYRDTGEMVEEEELPFQSQVQQQQQRQRRGSYHGTVPAELVSEALAEGWTPAQGTRVRGNSYAAFPALPPPPPPTGFPSIFPPASTSGGLGGPRRSNKEGGDQSDGNGGRS